MNMENLYSNDYDRYKKTISKVYSSYRLTGKNKKYVEVEKEYNCTISNETKCLFYDFNQNAEQFILINYF